MIERGARVGVMSMLPHHSPPGAMPMQPGGQFAQVNGAAPNQGHVQRAQYLAAINESVWVKIGMSLRHGALPDGSRANQCCQAR